MKKYIILLFLLLFAVSASALTLSANDTGITWISNTDQCLSRCESWLEIDTFQKMEDVYIPLVPNTEFNLTMTKETEYMTGLEEYGIEVYEKNPVTIIDYCSTEKLTVITKDDLDLNGELCSVVGCVEGKEEKTCDCLRDIKNVCGSHIDFEIIKVSDNFFGFTFETGRKYLLRIWGNRKATLGYSGVDWVLTFDDRKLTEWDWWDSSWLTKYPINSLVVSEDLNTTSWINLQGLDFSGLSSACTDGADITVVNETSQTEVTDLNFQGWNGTITDTDVNILFKVTEALPANTYNGEYYIYSNNAACTANNNRTIYESAFDNFEDNDFTANNFWWQVEGTFTPSVDAAAAKNGSYGLKIDIGVGQNGVIKTNGFTNANQPDKPPYKICYWIQTGDATITYAYLYTRGGGQATGYFGISADNFIASVGGGATFTGWGATPLDGTWYKLCMDFPKTGNLTFDIYNSSEVFVERWTSAVVRTGALQSVEIQAAGTSTTVYVDDISVTFPRKPTYTLGAMEETDAVPPVVYPISLSGFVYTENGYIDGTGYFYAIITDDTDVNNCDYTINGTDWLTATWDGVYCTTPTFSIIDKQFYSLNIMGIDTSTNSAKGTDLNFTGNVALVDATAITDDDFENLGFIVVYQVFIGIAIMASFIAIFLALVYLNAVIHKK